VIDCDTNTVHRLRTDDLWGESLEDYLGHVAAYARANPDELPAFSWGEPDDLSLAAFFRQRLREPFAPHLSRQRLLLDVVGDHETRSYLVDVGRGTFARVNPVPAPPSVLLEIRIPASLVRALVDRLYDPFSALFSYRIGFTLHHEGTLPAQEEVWLYIVSLISLFRPDLQDDVLRDRAA
jgi:hypothetical protein